MRYLSVLILAVLMTACATKYSVKINPDGTGEWKSTSYREAEAVRADFTKDGDKVEFHLVAQGVTDDTSEAAVAITSVAAEAATAAALQAQLDALDRNQ